MNRFAEYLSGGIIRKKIMKENKKNIYLIFPEEDKRLSYYGLLYADDYRHEKDAKKVIIITTSMDTAEKAEKLVKSRKKIITLKQKDMNNLLYNLSFRNDLMGESNQKELIYISALYPYGEGGRLLYEDEVFDIRHFVWNRLYHRETFYYAEEPSV